MLVLSLLLKSLWLYRCGMLHRTRIDIDTARLSNTLSIDFLWFNDEDCIRKRLLALSSRELIREDLDFNTKDTLTEEDMSGGRVDKVADLMISV